MSGKQAKKVRILVVDDSPEDLAMICLVLVEEEGYEVACAQSVSEGNELVRKALQARKPFDIALVDLKIGPDSGAEFARRLKEIIVDIRVAIITGNYDPAAAMLSVFTPDETIIKTARGFNESKTLSEAVKRLIAPRRIRQDPLDVTTNLWTATSHLYGINSLTPLTCRSSGEEEKRTDNFISLAADKYWINTVVYPGYPGDNVQPASFQSTIGCDKRCIHCINWRNQKGPSGKIIPYVRPLTTEEYLAQFYLIVRCPRIKNLFSDTVDTSLTVNMSGPGDSLANNLTNCMSFFKRLVRIEKPVINFIITSVGDEDRLQEYLDRYIDFPRVTFYWSVESVLQRLRTTLKLGTFGQRLEKLADLYEEIARKTGRPVTASFALFKGINNIPQEAKRIADFFRDRPLFKIKLMAGAPGSMPCFPDMTTEDVIQFRQMLLDAGVQQDIRIREIFGLDEYCGCGNTTAPFLMEGRQEED
ncbi:MAG: response regulator [Candidatus Paceibacterota bacterium]|jgi:adenine C2-methylase RlmN of 23S rRNA A2503 and tRNA A37